MVDKTLAGNGDLGSFEPEQLFAGETPVRTSRKTFLTGQVFAQFEVVGIDAAGKVVKLADETGEAHFVLPHAIDTSATGYNADADAPVYEEACFNHEILVWPAAANTLAERQAMFARGNPKITVERVL
jgi:hypothetical protein